ncbi:MAG: hypothetical protein QOF43_323 [Gaiellaceae bacterium]|nr:hypothetical protein [Gaiellaceae bacterium]
MGFFRRRESLHEKLAREGGLDERAPREQRPFWQEPGMTGNFRPPAADATVVVDAPDVEGNAVKWVTLPDGTLLVEDGPDGSLDALAAGVEQELSAPYRARAARQTGTLWAVQAAKIEVMALPDAPDGDTIDVTSTADGRSFSVDGAQVFGSLPALQERGEQEGREYAVRAERLDGDFWEVKAAAL